MRQESQRGFFYIQSIFIHSCFEPLLQILEANV